MHKSLYRILLVLSVSDENKQNNEKWKERNGEQQMFDDVINILRGKNAQYTGSILYK